MTIKQALFYLAFFYLLHFIPEAFHLLLVESGYVKNDFLLMMISRVVAFSLFYYIIQKMTDYRLRIKATIPRDINLFSPIITIIGMVLIEIRIDQFVIQHIQGNEAVNNIYNTQLEGINLFLISFLSSVILAPVIEELLFKGLILDNLLKNYKNKQHLIIVLTAFLFALIHLNPVQFIPALFWGIISGLWYKKTGSVLICILGHGLHNLVFYIFNIYYYYGNEVHVSDFWLLTGLVLSALGLYMFNKPIQPIGTVNCYFKWEGRYRED